MRILKQGMMHKRNLGFFSPSAHILVEKVHLETTTARFFCLVQGDMDTVQLRCFLSSGPVGEDVMTMPTETLSTSPELGLKAIYALSSTTQLGLGEHGVLSLCTKERTVLLCSVTEGETEAWHAALKGALTGVRASRRVVMEAEASASPTNAATSPSATTTTTTTTTTTPNPNASPLDSIEGVLATPRLREKFRAFVKFAFASENLDFYEGVEALDQIKGNDAQFKALAVQLVQNFIADEAPQQVNISAEQRKVLMAAMDGDDVAFIRFAFDVARKEIVDLMKRNFHNRFRNGERDAEERSRQRELLQGCFSQLWRSNGLDAFIAVVNASALVRNDTTILLDFFKHKTERAKQDLQNLTTVSQAFQQRAFQVPSLKSLARAMRTVLDTVSLQIKGVNEFLEDFNASVFTPLMALQQDVDAGFAQIASTHQSRVNQILTLRSQAKAALDAETKAYQAVEALRKDATSPKSPKKTQTAFQKAQKDLETASAVRTDAEIKMVEVESTNADTFHTAMDSLQSLFLHRIDTIQLLLQRCVLAEQTSLSRLELRLSSAFSDLADVDSVADLVAFAESAGKTATTDRRRMSVQQPLLVGGVVQAVPAAPAMAKQGSNPRGLVKRS